MAFETKGARMGVNTPDSRF